MTYDPDDMTLPPQTQKHHYGEPVKITAPWTCTYMFHCQQLMTFQ